MPYLLSVGPLKVYTLNLFVIMALLWGGFVVRKKSTEYYFRDQDVFDGVLLVAIVNFVVGWGLEKLGLGVYGFVGLWISVLIASIYITIRSKEKLSTVLDIACLGVIGAYSWWELGVFWSGGVLLDVFRALIFFVLFVCLWKLEAVYRTFNWYRGRKSTANTGFIFGTGLFLFGVVMVGGEFFGGGINVYRLVVCVILGLLGCGYVYHQSGRRLRDDLGGQRKK